MQTIFSSQNQTVLIPRHTKLLRPELQATIELIYARKELQNLCLLTAVLGLDPGSAKLVFFVGGGSFRRRGGGVALHNKKNPIETLG